MQSLNDIVLCPTTSAPIIIRLATPSDIYSMTELHCNSFSADEHIPMMLGPLYVQATYRWLVGSGRSFALVAESEESIIGLIAVCDGPFTRPMFFSCLPALLKSILLSPQLILKKRLWGRLFRKPSQPTRTGSTKREKDYEFAQMTIGAVKSAYRGLGIFPALVQALIPYCEKRGSKGIVAGVYKINTASRNVFVKNNWHEEELLETSDTVFYIYKIQSAPPFG